MCDLDYTNNDSTVGQDLAELELNDGCINLTSLPSLIISNLLNYLTPTELKNLRAVSTCTKSWVDFPKHLKRIKTYYKSNEQISAVINSEYKVYNFMSNGRDNSHANLISFLQKQKSTLVKLNLKGNYYPGQHSKSATNGTELIHILSSICPTLESLKFSMGGMLSTDDIDKLDQLDDNLIGLKCIEMEQNFDVRTQQIFQVFFTKCPNLRYIRLPNLVAYHKGDGNNSNVPPLGEDQSQALMNFLETHDKKISIDLGGLKRKHWDLNLHCRRYSSEESLPPHSSLFPITATQLLRLSKYANRLKLINVPTSSLPPNSLKLSEFTQRNLDTIIESIVCINPPTFTIPEEYYFPINAKIYIGITGGRANLMQNFYLPSHLNIVSIHFDWFISCSGGSRKLPRNIYENLFEIHRPTVQEFYISGCINQLSNTKLSTCYPNMKLFYAFGTDLDSRGCLEAKQIHWFSKEGNGVLDGLPNLQSVYLDHCRIDFDQMASFEKEYKRFKKLKITSSSFTDIIQGTEEKS